jgi:hypothetical protein
LKGLKCSSRVIVNSAGVMKIEHDDTWRRAGGVHAIDYRLHHVVCGAEGQLAGKPQADDSSRRRPDGGLALRISARRRAQPPEGTTPQEKRMRNLHSTGSPSCRQSVIAGRNSSRTACRSAPSPGFTLSG